MDYKNKTDVIERITFFSASQEEPEWVLQRRLEALHLSYQLDLPQIERVKIHRWGLADVSHFEQLDHEVEPMLPAFSDIEDNPLIIQGRTTTYYEQIPVTLAEQGVIFTDLFSAMREYPELLSDYWMTKGVKPEENQLTALHAAFFNSGLFLYVPKNVCVKDTVEALFYQLDDAPLIKHILIVADENSEVTYSETFLSRLSERAMSNIVVEVIAKNGAHVNIVSIDQMGVNTKSYIHRRAHVMQNAEVNWYVGEMNEGNVALQLNAQLVGEGANANMNVVAISSGKQVQGIDTQITNFRSHSVGHILQHGVILDQATLTFNAVGHILKGAKGADAQQESRVLMLSDKARGDANPILLIDEYEVTAGHAASAGQLDPDELYYLMSRGLSKKEAERLVTRGFLGAVTAKIKNQSIREAFMGVIDRKLG